MQTSRWPENRLILISLIAFCLLPELGIGIKYLISMMKNGGDILLTPVGSDFTNIWTAAKLTLAGRTDEIFSFQTWHAAQKEFLGLRVLPHVWGYPPHLLPWIAGFGLLPFLPALGVWTAATFALYAVAVCKGRPDWKVLALTLLAAPTSFENIIAGQNGFWVAALLAGGLRILDRRPVAAGVLFGLLTLKPHFGLLLPVALLAGRRWKALFSTAAAAALLGALSLALFGPQPWIDFLRITMPFNAEVLRNPNIGGHTAMYGAMMPGAFAALRILGFSVGAASVAGGLFAAAAALAVFRAFSVPVREELRSAIFLTAALIATPYSYTYDMTLVSASVVSFLCFRQGETLSARELTLLFFVWTCPLGITTLNLQHLPVAPLLLAGFLWYLTAFLEKEVINQPHAADGRLFSSPPTLL